MCNSWQFSIDFSPDFAAEFWDDCFHVTFLQCERSKTSMTIKECISPMATLSFFQESLSLLKMSLILNMLLKLVLFIIKYLEHKSAEAMAQNLMPFKIKVLWNCLELSSLIWFGCHLPNLIKLEWRIFRWKSSVTFHLMAIKLLSRLFLRLTLNVRYKLCFPE